MPRKSKPEPFNSLEEENIRGQFPKQVARLVEQLFTEQCTPVIAAVTLRCKLLEIQVKELEQRLGRLTPQTEAPVPSDAGPVDRGNVSQVMAFDEHSFENFWEDQEEEDDDEIPF